jgi:hypothetical protein
VLTSLVRELRSVVRVHVRLFFSSASATYAYVGRTYSLYIDKAREWSNVVTIGYSVSSQLTAGGKFCTDQGCQCILSVAMITVLDQVTDIVDIFVLYPGDATAVEY